MPCPECTLLRRKYLRAMRAIDAVVTGKSDSLAERIVELNTQQDLRNAALAALYEHKAMHPKRRPDELRE